MKNILLLLLCFVLGTGLNSSFGQEDKVNRAKFADLARQKFDNGMNIIETAQVLDDFKLAIAEFEESLKYSMIGGNYLELEGSLYYNLGLLYDKIEDFNKADYYLTLYICSDPPPDDSAEVKSMMDQINYKAQQFINPQTLTGIWCYSWPKEQCEPRLEIREENGIVKARALYSEGTEMNNQLNVPHEPGQYIAMGSFVPIKWDYFETKLTILDAPYFTCAKGFEADMCPSPVTFYLKRTGVNRLEGNVIFNEKYYLDYNKPDWIQHNFKVVYERVAE